jgi:hypothetical protein
MIAVMLKADILIEESVKNRKNAELRKKRKKAEVSF